MQGRSQDLSGGGVLLRFGWTKSGGPGALPRKNFGFKVPQPLFF